MRGKLWMAGVGALVLAGAALAQARAKETIISNPANTSWTFDGGPKVKAVNAEGLPGGKGLLVTVAKKGVNPWDVQARMGLKDGVAAGDMVTFGFYARAELPDPGKETATVYVRVSRSVAPYDGAVEGPLEIGKEWMFHCVSGAAKIALPQVEANVVVQLAGEKRGVAFGPWMVTKIPAAGPNARSGLPCGKAPGAA